MCKNNKKVKKEMSSYLDCEIYEIEIEDPTRSSTTWQYMKGHFPVVLVIRTDLINRRKRTIKIQ